MVNTLINQGIERTKTYEGVLQIDVGSGNTKQLKFIQEFVITLDDTDVDRDRIDDGSPMFSPIGDVLGTFSFTLKNSVDMYDAVTPATNTETISYWLEQIALRKFPEVDFIPVFNAPDSAGNKFARIRLKCRIMSAGPERGRDRGSDEFSAEGEIISLTSALREAT